MFVDMIGFQRSAVAYYTGVETRGNFLFNAVEGSSANEQDILGIHRDHFLIRVFASSLRRYIHY
ncbi:hypothetical protein SDC9_177917 [bioreactor metagenome]|uniref:Uncharacterized protein n=1 Tax=bioreactor metagenome TaxID=1076179 RepID=A0A645GW05_9ZZZZ